MSRKSSRDWMREHLRDPFVQEAQAQGYRSRAAFKLIQMDTSDRLFKKGQHVIDLGAAPGGWSQVAASRVGPRGSVVAVDLLPMDPLTGVTFIQGDFLNEAVHDEINSLLNGHVDLVLSDMAPNLTGVKERDQVQAMEIGFAAQKFAAKALKSSGKLVVKVFQGTSMGELRAAMGGEFTKIKVRKPSASRNRSAEIYLIAARR